LSVMEQERDDSDSLDGDFEGLEEPVPQLKVNITLESFRVV